MTNYPPARLLVSVLLLGLVSASVRGADVEQRRPTYHHQRDLVPSEAGGEQRYLAFPALIDLGSEVLVSFKHGVSHGGSPGASLDLIHIDRATDAVTAPQVIARLDDKIMQMGEWVKFPNGDLASYIDAQQVQKPARIGMRDVRSTDGGKSFSPVERVGVIDGVEYGYPFCFAVEGKTTWMMAMCFSNLTGGYSVYPPRHEAGQVCMLRSADNGRTWTFVRNLSREFGDIPINESSFVRCGDGYLVATRGYDNRARIHLTDDQFKVKQQADLTETYPFIESYVGRPRIFTRDGRFYLMGRNWTERAPAKPAAAVVKDGGPNMPPAMQLCLFRIDPSSLAVTSYAVLDNADRANVTDGYYPMPYFVERRGKTYFRVVDYKGMNHQPPHIVEFEYLWNEVR